MPAVSGDIPNFINGVSQQTPAMRLPSQSEACENMYPTIVDGSTRRPPTEFVAGFGAEFPNAFTHIILRDDVEKYILVIETDGTPHVFDFEGTEMTLTDESGTYLTDDVTDVRTQIRALTVADHTFLINTKKEVAYGTETSDVRYPGEALINVMAGNYGKTYRITVNGTVVAEYQTPDGSVGSHSTFIDTSYIAAQLVSDLVTAGLTTAPWSVGRYANVIRIVNTSADFTASVEDGYSGRAMKLCKDVVQKFSDLPLHGPDGIVMKVVGQDGKTDEDYYVKFEKSHSDNYDGVWRECVAKGTRLGLDAETMPHLLVRNADGTFTLKKATWTGRVAGDLDSNPDPSFVGQTIVDAFFHKNRLGFLTAENAVLSESGDFWNFYRTSMMTLLDTDLIDVAASHVKVSLLKHAVPFNGIMLVFTDQTQFGLKGNETLTPKTVHLDPLTELSSHPRIRPETAGTSVYFVSERESYASLYEYFLDKALENADSEDVASHAPTYVPSGVHDMAASSELNMIALVSSGDPDGLYLYKFLWSGKEKLQSAWVRWTLPGVDIANIAFDKNDLLTLLRRDGELRLEKLNAEQGSLETIYLDSRVTISSGTYNALDDTTGYVSPYNLPEEFVCVTTTGGELPEGVELPVTRLTDTTFTVDGDMHAQPVVIGTLFRSETELSELFYRTDQKAPVQAGRLQVLAMDLNYARSAYFRVEVTAQGRPTRTYPFTGRVIGDPDNVTGQVVLDGGRFSFPVMSRSDRVTIKLVNDTWLPCAFTSAKWKGIFNPNTRQQ